MLRQHLYLQMESANPMGLLSEDQASVISIIKRSKLVIPHIPTAHVDRTDSHKTAAIKPYLELTPR